MRPQHGALWCPKGTTAISVLSLGGQDSAQCAHGGGTHVFWLLLALPFLLLIRDFIVVIPKSGNTSAIAIL